MKINRFAPEVLPLLLLLLLVILPGCAFFPGSNSLAAKYDILFQNASAKIYRNDFEGSKPDLDQLVKLRPKAPESLWARACTLFFEQKKAPEALALCDQALALQPNFVDAYLLRSVIRDAVGKFQEAAADAEQALRLQPKNATAFFLQGTALIHLGRLANAIPLIDAAILLRPGYPEALTARGNIELLEGKWDSALSRYQLALKNDPHLEAAYYGSAQAYISQGNTIQAVESVSTLLSVRGANYGALLLRGKLNSFLGKLSAAVEDFSAAIALDPKNPEALVFRARAYVNLGRADEAVADCDHALEQKPQSSEIYLVRALAYSLYRNPIRALKDFDAAIALNPKEATSYTARARFKLRIVDFAGAIRDLTTATTLSDNDAGAFYLLGYIKFLQFNYAAALAALNKAIAVNPQLAEAYLYCGMTRVATGDHRVAILDFNKAIALKPDAATYVERAFCFAIDHKYAAAIADLDEAIRLGPDREDFYQYRARMNLASGKSEAALADLSKSIALKPTAVAYAYRASANRGQQQREAAVADYKKALELDPSLPWTLIGLADKNIARKDYEGALTLLDLLIAMDSSPKSLAAAHSTRSGAYVGLNRLLEAIADFEATLKLTSDHSLYHGLFFQLGTLKSQTGDYTGAVEAYTSAIQLMPSFWPVVTARAAAFVRLERWDEAQRDFDTVVENMPSADSYYRRGEFWFRRENWDAAIADFEKTLELRPAHKEAKDLRDQAQAFRSKPPEDISLTGSHAR